MLQKQWCVPHPTGLRSFGPAPCFSARYFESPVTAFRPSAGVKYSTEVKV
jgi:hypothetical protein